MNAVLIPTYNCAELAKKAIRSVIEQDIPTALFVWDNGSTDGFQEWLREQDHPWTIFMNAENLGVSHAWNTGIDFIFDGGGHLQSPASQCLVINQDVILPPWFYRSLLEYNVDFVTGVSVESMDAIATPQPPKDLVPSPDFSAFMVSRKAWNTVGRFDEAMVNYASDNDWHIRAHRAGVNLWNSGVHFYHERSSTIRLASPRERRAIELQADVDREAFRDKYGFYPWDPRYSELLR